MKSMTDNDSNYPGGSPESHSPAPSETWQGQAGGDPNQSAWQSGYGPQQAPGSGYYGQGQGGYGAPGQGPGHYGQQGPYGPQGPGPIHYGQQGPYGPQGPGPGYYGQQGYYGAQGPYRDPNDSPSLGFAILGFFFPMVGLILWLVWRDSSPLKGKSAGKGALVSVIVWTALTIITVVASVALFANFSTGGVVINGVPVYPTPDGW